MKPVFHARLLNDYFGDPCLFIRILYEKRALLFDLGTIHSLKPSELHKITDVFVTHTHNHFMGSTLSSEGY
jgi:ribonuclease Z